MTKEETVEYLADKLSRLYSSTLERDLIDACLSLAYTQGELAGVMFSKKSFDDLGKKMDVSL